MSYIIQSRAGQLEKIEVENGVLDTNLSGCWFTAGVRGLLGSGEWNFISQTSLCCVAGNPCWSYRGGYSSLRLHSGL